MRGVSISELKEESKEIRLKRLFATIMLVLTALSVGCVILYSVHKTMATGGESPEIHFDQEEINVKTGTDEKELLKGSSFFVHIFLKTAFAAAGPQCSRIRSRYSSALTFPLALRSS